MKTEKIVSNIFLVFGIGFFVVLSSDLASADAWWGYGARRSEWVLSHGGTIISYEIDNISGRSDEYKAVMFDKNGKYVEKEFGKKAKFDDAKNGAYTIRAYRGGTEDKTSYKGGKEFASITVTAHPGETIKIRFNYEKKKAAMSTNYVKPVKKMAAKPATDEIIKPESETEDKTQNDAEEFKFSYGTEKLAIIEKKEESLAEFMEEMIHPDVMAMESEKKLIVEKEKNKNIFEKFWDSIVKFFRF